MSLCAAALTRGPSWGGVILIYEGQSFHFIKIACLEGPAGAWERSHLTDAGTACGLGLEITTCPSAAQCWALCPNSHHRNESYCLGPGHQVAAPPSLVGQVPGRGDVGRPERKANTDTSRWGWKVGGAQVVLQLHSCPTLPSSKCLPLGSSREDNPRAFWHCHSSRHLLQHLQRGMLKINEMRMPGSWHLGPCSQAPVMDGVTKSEQGWFQDSSGLLPSKPPGPGGGSHGGSLTSSSPQQGAFL